jgi:hypothetical protein
VERPFYREAQMIGPDMEHHGTSGSDLLCGLVGVAPMPYFGHIEETCGLI